MRSPSNRVFRSWSAPGTHLDIVLFDSSVRLLAGTGRSIPRPAPLRHRCHCATDATVSRRSPSHGTPRIGNGRHSIAPFVAFAFAGGDTGIRTRLNTRPRPRSTRRTPRHGRSSRAPPPADPARARLPIHPTGVAGWLAVATASRRSVRGWGRTGSPVSGGVDGSKQAVPAPTGLPDYRRHHWMSAEIPVQRSKPAEHR